MHEYVTFYNVLTDSFYDGFAVLDGNRRMKLCYPIAYLLLEKQDKLHILDDYNKTNFPIDVISISDGIYQKPIPPTCDELLRGLNWILNFNIEEKHIPYLNQIAIFFEFLVNYRSDFDLRLEQARSAISSAAPVDLITELELFSLSNKN